MKHDHHKKFAGVWLDHNEALFVTTEDHKNYGEMALRKKIKASHHPNSGSEHKEHNAARGDLNHYLKTLVDGLKEFDEILLIGPGKSQEELRNMMLKDSHFKNKLIQVESSEHLTENQLVARVKSHYQSKMHNH